jgi:hypothetical protein
MEHADERAARKWWEKGAPMKSTKGTRTADD